MEYWKKVDGNGKTTTVESCSNPHKKPDAIQITKVEYDAFIASLSVIEPEPVRDLAQEIDELKEKVRLLENR